jgi:hypothetical protein
MPLTISAKDLAQYGSDKFCPRCGWVRLHVKQLPFQIFPGIFSTIDRYNKLIIESYFEREQSLPAWLGQLGEVKTYIPAPHWSKFSVADADTGITLRGEADGIFRMADGSHTIVDYKTAKYTAGQGALFEVYEAQLNGYAYIGERLALSPVSQLALIYMEPATDASTAQTPHLVNELGFSMGLKATVVPVEVKPDQVIPALLRRAGELNDMPSPPDGHPARNDCRRLDDLVRSVAVR